MTASEIFADSNTYVGTSVHPVVVIKVNNTGNAAVGLQLNNKTELTGSEYIPVIPCDIVDELFTRHRRKCHTVTPQLRVIFHDVHAVDIGRLRRPEQYHIISKHSGIILQNRCG